MSECVCVCVCVYRPVSTARLCSLSVCVYVLARLYSQTVLAECVCVCIGPSLQPDCAR